MKEEDRFTTENEIKEAASTRISKESDAVQVPITGTLDLHTFRPEEIHSLIPEYLQACIDEGIFHVRIVHGKGKGVLRRIVQSILEKHPAVISFGHEGGSGGSWGATVIRLKCDL